MGRSPGECPERDGKEKLIGPKRINAGVFGAGRGVGGWLLVSYGEALRS